MAKIASHSQQLRLHEVSFASSPNCEDKQTRVAFATINTWI